MNRFKKIIAAAAVGITGIACLASCGSKENAGYKEWTVSGMDIRRDGNIIFLTVDDVIAKKDGEDFIVFIGSSGDTYAKAMVGSFQMLADYMEYDTCIYVCDVVEEVKKASTLLETKNKLGIKEIVDSTGRDLVAVCYKDGAVYFDTAKYDVNDKNSPLNRFALTNTQGVTDISFTGLAQYAFENSTIKVEE